MSQDNNLTCLAALIDHTLLRPEATEHEVINAAHCALRWGVATVCVSPVMVATVMGTGLNIPISSVVGFPCGYHRQEVKVCEAALAVQDGAREIDMVINIGAMLEGKYIQVYDDIACCRDAIPETTLKVIIESALLQQYGGPDLIIQACKIAEDAGADFVKTSTGFHPAGGASLEAVHLIAHTVGSRLGVKASGGIRTKDDAQAMIAAGATRLGISHTQAILTS